MKGIAPIRRTVKYLQAGKLVLKDRVQVFSVHYNLRGDNHQGAKYVYLMANYSAVPSNSSLIRCSFVSGSLCFGICPRCSSRTRTFRS